MRRARRSSLLALCLVSAAAAAPRDRPADQEAARRQMEEAERARAAGLAGQKRAAVRADEAAGESRRLAEQRVAAAARLREAELATLEASSRMAALTKRQQDAEARLRARAAELAPLLPIIERLSLYPAETLLAVEAEPDAAMRGVLVLQGIGRGLEQQARFLRAEQAALNAATRAVDEEAPRLAASRSVQERQAADLDRQIAAAQSRGREAADEAADFARQAAAGAAQAESLRGVIATIEAQRQVAEAKARDETRRAERGRDAAQASSARRRQEALARPVDGSLSGRPEGRVDGGGGTLLTSPVAGSVLRGWGEATEAGPANGISYRVPSGARVVAPCRGRAVFAAPFRSYGRLLIVDCGGGYHVVLAGLERLDVQAGTPVQAGEPVGVMEGGAPLYVELRRDGRPVNPAPWMRAKG